MSSPPRKGQAAFDRWSIPHLLTGFGLGMLPLRWPFVLALLVAYEAFEGGLRQYRLEEGGVFEYESWPNIAADIMLGMLGYALTQWGLGWRLW
jgi:hypothetical protein